MPTNDMDYFDYAAATPLDPQVRRVMEPFWEERFFNPSATYAPARAVADELEAARARVAHWLGARPAEVVFTAGGTEANNLAIHGIMQRFPKANIVTSAIEHDAVLHPAGRYVHRITGVTADGLLDMEQLNQAIDGQTVLVSVMYANNEVGTVQPLKAVAQLVQSVREMRRQQGNRLPIYLHTDACQASNYLDVHVARLGVDLLTLNGGKMYGPKQSGVLYVKAGLELQPQVLGGGQESGLRSGTENVAACVGLSAALDVAQNARHEQQGRMQDLQQHFLAQLSAHVPQATVNGSLKKRLPNNVHVTLPGTDNERVLLELESQGILAAAGSACSASNEEPSHVLRAMGLSDADAQASLRFTMGRATSAESIDRLVAALAKLVA